MEGGSCCEWVTSIKMQEGLTTNNSNKHVCFFIFLPPNKGQTVASLQMENMYFVGVFLPIASVSLQLLSYQFTTFKIRGCVRLSERQHRKNYILLLPIYFAMRHQGYLIAFNYRSQQCLTYRSYWKCVFIRAWREKTHRGTDRASVLMLTSHHANKWFLPVCCNISCDSNNWYWHYQYYLLVLHTPIPHFSPCLSTTSWLFVFLKKLWTFSWHVFDIL